MFENKSPTDAHWFTILDEFEDVVLRKVEILIEAILFEELHQKLISKLFIINYGLIQLLERFNNNSL